MERVLKINSCVLRNYLKPKQLEELLNLHMLDVGEAIDVKLIKKAIKKQKRATVATITEKLKGEFGVIKLRRLLDTYEDVFWITEEEKKQGRGRPTKIYKRIK